MKTLTFLDADTNAAADAEGSTIALRECCSGELKVNCKYIYPPPTSTDFF